MEKTLNPLNSGKDAPWFSHRQWVATQQETDNFANRQGLRRCDDNAKPTARPADHTELPDWVGTDYVPDFHQTRTGWQSEPAPEKPAVIRSSTEYQRNERWELADKYHVRRRPKHAPAAGKPVERDECSPAPERRPYAAGRPSVAGTGPDCSAWTWPGRWRGLEPERPNQRGRRMDWTAKEPARG